MKKFVINITPDQIEAMGMDADKLINLLDTIFGSTEVPDPKPEPKPEPKVQSDGCCAECSCEVREGFDCECEFSPVDSIVEDCMRFSHLVDVLGSIPEDSGITDEEMTLVDSIAEEEGFMTTTLEKVTRWCEAHPMRGL